MSFETPESMDKCCNTCRCDRCRDDYWNEEVTDNEN